MYAETSSLRRPPVAYVWSARADHGPMHHKNDVLPSTADDLQKITHEKTNIIDVKTCANLHLSDLTHFFAVYLVA